MADEKRQDPPGTSEPGQMDSRTIRQLGGRGLSEPAEGPEEERRRWEPPEPELGPDERPLEGSGREATEHPE